MLEVIVDHTLEISLSDVMEDDGISPDILVEGKEVVIDVKLPGKVALADTSPDHEKKDHHHYGKRTLIYNLV